MNRRIAHSVDEMIQQLLGLQKLLAIDYPELLGLVEATWAKIVVVTFQDVVAGSEESKREVNAVGVDSTVTERTSKQNNFRNGRNIPLFWRHYFRIYNHRHFHILLQLLSFIPTDLAQTIEPNVTMLAYPPLADLAVGLRNASVVVGAMAVIAAQHFPVLGATKAIVIVTICSLFTAIVNLLVHLGLIRVVTNSNIPKNLTI